MEGYEQTPPGGLWEAIEGGLHAGAAPIGAAATGGETTGARHHATGTQRQAAGSRHRAAAFPWMWALAGAAAVLLAVLILWHPAGEPAPYLAESQDVDRLVVADLNADDDLPLESKETPAEGVSETVAEDSAETAAEQRFMQSSDNQQIVQNRQGESTQAIIDNSLTDNDLEKTPQSEPPSKPSQKHPGSAEQQRQPSQKQPGSAEHSSHQPEMLPITRKAGSSRRLTASLIAGGVPGGASDSYIRYGMTGGSSQRMAPAAILSRNKAAQTDVNYSVPFRMGILLNYSFTEYWGIESGLQFSNLSTKVSSESGTISKYTDNIYSYLGIPLMVVYTPWRIGQFSLYTSAGPMFELGVLHRVREEAYMGNELLSRESSIYGKVNDAVWSLALNAGAQWQLGEYGGLFIQPGVSWHFPGSAGADTYYTNHPFSFDISAGVRFTF